MGAKLKISNSGDYVPHLGKAPPGEATLDKVPPCNIQAETCVLGAMLLDIDKRHDTVNTARAMLSAGDFYREVHQAIFDELCLAADAGEAIDLVTFKARMISADRLDAIGGEPYLIDLVEGVPSTANIEYYANIVREKSVRRQIITTSGDMYKAAHDETNDAAAMLEDLRGKLDTFSASTGGALETTCLADVKPEEITWLWQDRLPLGMVCLLAGDPAMGKSLVTLDIASRLSTGTPWPDGSPAMHGETLLLSAEDDASRTIRPRLDNAGAETAKIHLIEGTRDGKDFRLDIDLGRLRRHLEHHADVRLIIIDPLSAYLGDIDSHRNAELREMLKPLTAIASDFQVTILLVNHLTKGGSTKAIYRSLGSIGINATARSVYYVVKDAEDDTRRLFLPVKCNVVKEMTGLAFRIVDHNGLPALRWEQGDIEISADRLLADEAGNGDDTGVRAEARDWLKMFLENGSQPATEILAAGKAAGLKDRNVRNAGKDLKVEHILGAFQGKWEWELPK